MSSSSHERNEESPEDDADNDDIVVPSDGPRRYERNDEDPLPTIATITS